MASVMELAELSRAVYFDKTLVEVKNGASLTVWQRGNAWANPFGYYAAEYKSLKGEVVLAFRGTDDGWDLGVDDTMIAVGLPSPQSVEALINTFKSDATIYTGHSLGGALALLAGNARDRQAVTFNAPGQVTACAITSVLMLNIMALGRCLFSERAINVRVEYDAVSSGFTTGPQVGGRDVTLKADGCGKNLLCRHKMDLIVSKLQQNPDSFNEVSD